MEPDWKLLRGQFEWNQYKSHIARWYCNEIITICDDTTSSTCLFSDPPASYPCLVKTVSVRPNDDNCTLCDTTQVFVEVSDASFLIAYMVKS